MKGKNIILAAVVVIVFVLWLTGLIGLWTEGMAYIANDAKNFTDTKGHLVEGEYSLFIDLSNLESNIGKELYNDGTHRIYVSRIKNESSIKSGGYAIGFRSIGQYSLKRASLISGVHHAMVDGNSFTTTMSAKMTAQYNRKTYISSVFGLSGLNYKDGDDFAFHIFPSESYKKNAISFNEKGIARLTVTGLYKNIWINK